MIEGAPTGAPFCVWHRSQHLSLATFGEDPAPSYPLVPSPERLANYAARLSAGEPAHPRRLDFDAWSGRWVAAAPIIELGRRSAGPIDLAARPKDPTNLTTLEGLTAYVAARHLDTGVEVGYGGYLERRSFYGTPVFAGDNGRQRSVHLGLDLWSPAGEQVSAPLGGRVVGARYHGGARDYGATIVLRHEVVLAGRRSLVFYTLYGHLDRDSLDSCRVGQWVPPGGRVGRTGAPCDNGGWPPHLHFQVFLDDLGYEGDFPGVCLAEEAELWAGLCPDPGPLSGVIQ